MVDTFSDDEQVVALKEWWKQYGLFMVGGVIVGLALYFGWSAWQKHNAQARATAGYDYQIIVENLIAGNSQAASTLVEREAKVQYYMPYALMEELLSAQIAVQEQKLDEAAAHLQHALAGATDDFFQELVSIRLARILLEQNKPTEALKIVSISRKIESADLFAVKGDILVALGEISQAREAYTQAWELFPIVSPKQQIVGMLLADLPGESTDE